MSAGIMNPMMVMRILDWVSDTTAPRQHYWPTTDRKKPQEICQLASHGRSDHAGISNSPRVLPCAIFSLQLMDCKSEHIPKLRGADGLYRTDREQIVTGSSNVQRWTARTRLGGR
jgi:hypothetical protein